MKFTFQILQLYSKQRIPSIVLTCETKRYFFNLPEASQRLNQEHSIRFKKGNPIFFTQMSTEHLGGLFGCLLTLYETKLAFDVAIYGPPGFSAYLDNVRFLFASKILAFSAYDFFNNDNKLLGISCKDLYQNVLMLPNYNKLFWHMNEYLSGIQKTKPKEINDAQSFIHESKYYKDDNLEVHPLLLTPDKLPGKPTLSYICKIKKYRGKVLPEKIKEFNIPKKFIQKIIQEKELVIHGVLYKASDIQEPSEPSAILIIIDCPSPEYIESLITQESFKAYFEQNIDPNENSVKAVIHMSTLEVLTDPRYSQLFEKFSKDCEHIFINEKLKGREISINLLNKSEKEESKMEEEISFEKSESMIEKKIEAQPYSHFDLTNRFHSFFPQHFPKLETLKKSETYDLEQLLPNIPNKYIHTNLIEYVMTPVKSEGFAPVQQSLKNFLRINQTELPQKFLKRKAKLETKNVKEALELYDKSILSLFNTCDPELVFLGTGSMVPSTFRNVSAIYLRFWQQGNTGMLLDCGEGTYFQLLHHYGAETTRELLKNLAIIFITHVHADHHLGTMNILLEREKILKEENIKRDPVFLVVPYICAPWMAKYQSVDKLNYRIIFSQHISSQKERLSPGAHKQTKTENFSKHGLGKEKNSTNSKDGDEEFKYVEDPDQGNVVLAQQQQSYDNVQILEKFLIEKLGVNGFKTIDVKHCPQAYAILIEHTNGWKFVYSGDTRPSQNLIKEAGQVTILVHEATFTSDMQKAALSKMHSTETEAIEVGMKMDAWRTVLTHFSQRFSKASQSSIQKSQDPKEKYIYEYNKYNTIRTFDHLTTKFSELKDLPQVSRCYDSMYVESEVIEEQLLDKN